MMKRLSSAVLICALAAGASAAPKVHGHRGCRGVLPENTLAAFDEALRIGADVLELDMGVTKDGVVVVSHNKQLDGTLCLGPDGKPAEALPIHSLSLEQLQSYDCGALKNPHFPRQSPRPGQRIPRLADVFELVKGSTYPAAAGVEFNIETKIVPNEPDLSPVPKEFARLVVETVAKYGLESRVIVQSFDRRTLEEVREIEPRIRLAMLISDNLPDLAAIAAAQKVEIISPNALWITRSDVDALHKLGVQVVPWTVNSEAGWTGMLALGADAIITDYPADLIAWMKARGLR
jgi:glycerophosphoryl diester phosphodiesterase